MPRCRTQSEPWQPASREARLHSRCFAATISPPTHTRESRQGAPDTQMQDTERSVAHSQQGGVALQRLLVASWLLLLCSCCRI